MRFNDLDFGAWGSDTLTIHLFPLTPDPFDFDIKAGDALLLRPAGRRARSGTPIKRRTIPCPVAFDR